MLFRFVILHFRSSFFKMPSYALKLVNSDRDLEQIVREIYIDSKTRSFPSLVNLCANTIVDNLPSDEPGLHWDHILEPKIEATKNWIKCISMDQLELPLPLVRFLVKTVLRDCLKWVHCYSNYDEIYVRKGYIYCIAHLKCCHVYKIVNCPYWALFDV